MAMDETSHAHASGKMLDFALFMTLPIPTRSLIASEATLRAHIAHKLFNSPTADKNVALHPAPARQSPLEHSCLS